MVIEFDEEEVDCYDHDISSDDDSYENIEYVEASPLKLEYDSLEEENEDQEEKEFDLEDIFSNPKMLFFGGLTGVVISDNSNDPLLELPEFESFHFDLDPSFPRPPPEPPDIENSLIVEIDAPVINNVGEINVEDGDSFTYVIRTFLPFLTYPEYTQKKHNMSQSRIATAWQSWWVPNDIYSLIDSNDTAKDLWDALERQMRGSGYGEQDRKAAILYEYETFKATEGEQLLDTYLRYLQVINDLKKCGYKKDNCELNYKFLNNSATEWKQYGTLMRQTKKRISILMLFTTF
ncbi:hypothetical protein Tco_0568592 [Tanacetum coccineum]